jgi:hypothetical protein
MSLNILCSTRTLELCGVASWKPSPHLCRLVLDGIGSEVKSELSRRARVSVYTCYLGSSTGLAERIVARVEDDTNLVCRRKHARVRTCLE